MTAHNWLLMILWTALGFLIYFLYGYRSSVVGRAQRAPSP
jgi:APA family basic amino acid/polyamine antiporter